MLKIILKFSFVKFSGKVRDFFCFRLNMNPGIAITEFVAWNIDVWAIKFLLYPLQEIIFSLCCLFLSHVCSFHTKEFVKNYKKPPKGTLVVTSKWTIRINFESEISKKNIYVYCLWNIQYVNLRFITKTVVEHKSELIYPLQLLFKTYSFYF